MNDRFGVKRTIETADGAVTYFDLMALEERFPGLRKVPYSVRILLEALVRNCDGRLVTEEQVAALAAWGPGKDEHDEFGFMPARVLLQDFTGVPAVADLAAMRDAVGNRGGDPSRIDPLIPVDLVIDHSVQVDASGTSGAFAENIRKEFSRNKERYAFLRWGQQAFRNLRVVPPGTGIVHQVNLEHLARVVQTRKIGHERFAFPDSLVGTDSHTTMINGLGVLGWGVGGIEAEAAMLGQPIAMTAPAVVGVELRGRLKEGVTATDLVLAVTQRLRKHGVVEKFVEFYGDGLDGISLADRATIANMAPEYGATVGYFPVDEETLRYLRQTGRESALVDLVERYMKAQGLFRTAASPVPTYTETLTIELSAVEPALAGPKRPQDRVPLSAAKAAFLAGLTAPTKEQGYGLPAESLGAEAPLRTANGAATLRHGSVVIAAITSCTNTSNPSVMLAAGLLAKKAVDRGLSVPAYVKTSLAPGSKAVTRYLESAGLLDALETLRFNLVGYGCTTCIGNSGPLDEAVTEAIDKHGLVAAAVLSGNRNFEGRVHAATRANYLASPPLVVAYALAGRVDIDLATEPLGIGSAGEPVYLRDVWPTRNEIEAAIGASLKPEMFREQYADAFKGGEEWAAVEAPSGDRYAWDPASTYIRRPPFFDDLSAAAPGDVRDARCLAMFGDSVTTDHISPAGSISTKSPAARYLVERGVTPADFNSYGARRGNHEVMMRGTFANTRLKNLLVPGSEGSVTAHRPSGEAMSLFDAAARYAEEGTPLVVIAGKDYGMGSSRDWAAKGVRLLGVRAVIFESVERIHRSNLVGMGVMPLEFMPGENAASLGLDGTERFDIPGISAVSPGGALEVTATADDGRVARFSARCRLDTPVELEYFRAGGIMPYVLKAMASEPERT
ncbi:MAG TPA: aconitate hydratase AcnA [Candidatus Eisenbacteria bacterium]|nr:aconitate hydratase AcnA [Candidatus Eisenbacteria bacterium]